MEPDLCFVWKRQKNDLPYSSHGERNQCLMSKVSYKVVEAVGIDASLSPMLGMLVYVFHRTINQVIIVSNRSDSVVNSIADLGRQCSAMTCFLQIKYHQG